MGYLIVEQSSSAVVFFNRFEWKNCNTENPLEWKIVKRIRMVPSRVKRLSHHVCEACGQMLPTAKDIPGRRQETENSLKTENFT